MSTFKLNSQPFQPSVKSRHIQKKMATMKIVYSSNYLKLLKEYNKDFPENCSRECIEFIIKTQEQQPEYKRESKSHSYRAQFTSKKRTDKIEVLIPTTKPIPIHHPSLIQSSNSSTSSSSSSSNSFDQNEMNPIKEVKELNEIQHNEINEKRKKSRLKQISFGKSTQEYHNYLSIIPKEQRLFSDPKTPDIETQISKRKWDKSVRRWRRSLHAFDTVYHENQIDLARALAFRLQNEHDPKKNIHYYSSSYSFCNEE